MLGGLAGSLSRALLLVVAAAAHHISSTPPSLANQTSTRLLSSPDTSSKECPLEKSDKLHGPLLFNKIGIALVRISPYTIWFFTAIEVAIRIASALPSSAIASSIIQTLSPYSPAPTALVSSVTAVYLAACIAVVVGYRIRASCFVTLGRHFTFTHTTLSEHQLVKDGPYSIVRHASYSGEVLVRGGTILMLICAGSWWHEFGPNGSWTQDASTVSMGSSRVMSFGSPLALVARWLLVFHVCWAIFNTSFLFWRSSLEDTSLREKFGEEWESYRKEVPYKFVPYIV